MRRFFTVCLILPALILTGCNINLPWSNEPLEELENSVVRGVIRTSGLSAAEQDNHRLESIDYQITDFNEDNPYGYDNIFLLIDPELADLFMGKCVDAVGILGSEQYLPSNPSQSVMSVNSLEGLDYADCNPYGDSVADTEEYELTKLTGVLDHSKRPAPDISYDYELWLDEPYYDPFVSTSTDTDEPLNRLDASPLNNDVWEQLETQIRMQYDSERVTLVGKVVWGYSESRYLLVHYLQ